jgi:hypothetical protein
MSKTYIFSHKNGNATVTITAENEDDAWSEIDEMTVNNKHMFRLDETVTEDEEE